MDLVFVLLKIRDTWKAPVLQMKIISLYVGLILASPFGLTVLGMIIYQGYLIQSTMILSHIQVIEIYIFFI